MFTIKDHDLCALLKAWWRVYMAWRSRSVLIPMWPDDSGEEDDDKG